MATTFLHLDIDNFGITAKIIERSNKQNLIKEDCRILFKDLPDAANTPEPFDSGIEVIARQLNLELCTTAVIFVSPLLISFRNIDLPFGSEKKIKQILPFELESLLPGMDESYISDFHIFNSSIESNLILSASIPESIVADYFTALERVGIKPVIITPKGYAAATAFLKKHKDKTTFVFLHIAGNDITLVLVKDRIPCMVRTFSASQNSPENLAGSVRQTIIGFNQRTGIDSSYDIFICSENDAFESGSVHEVFDESPGSGYGLSSLKHRIKGTSGQDKIDPDELLTAISPENPVNYLFNFCMGKYGTSSFIKTHFSSIAVSAGLFFCLLILMMLSVGFDNARLNKQISAVDKKALSVFKATFPDKKKIQDPYLQMKANIKNAEKKASENGQASDRNKYGNIKIIKIMNELSDKIPSETNMDISRFLFSGGRLILSGSTDNFNNVDNIKSQIESSVLFKKVNISSAAADKSGKKVNVKFIIQL